MRTKLVQSLLASVLAAGACSSLQAQLTQLTNFSANQAGGFSAGEIVAFDPGTDRLYVTSSGSNVHRLNIFDMSNPAAPTPVGTPIDYSTTFGAATDMLGLSSVALNQSKGFGVATLIPTTNTTTVGKVGFFDLSTGASIGTVDVGFHPDSVTFSQDGSRMIVVNEGEFAPASGTNAPGSITIFNLSTINSGNLANLTSLSGVTRDFSAGNLAAGVSINTLRNHNLPALGTTGQKIESVPVFNTAAPEALEPEYASVIGDKVYVSLQENNAVAEFDLVQDKWTEVKNLETISQLVDARDGGGTSITQNVTGLFMPDTVATYTSGGKTYVVTANEGDARPDDRDASKLNAVATDNNMNNLLDPDVFDTTAATGLRANASLGTLTVSRIDGDTDADGKIDVPTMFGTRSFTIWEDTAGGLVRVFDSNDSTATNFENIIATIGGFQDGRSDEKGPEPEGLTIGEINGRTYLFIGMERTAHIFQFDITNPLGVTFVDAELITFADAQRPEGMQFIPAADSPNGQNLLIVGYEGAGTSATEKIGVFTVIPEPSSAAALAGAGVLGLAALRRRRVRA